MRTFANARKLRLNMCQLNKMTDAELTEELRIVNLKLAFSFDYTGHNPKPWDNTDTAVDIKKSWSVASKADRGFAVK